MTKTDISFCVNYICRKIYIGKGSKPAIAYGEALNVGEQVLGIVDPLYKPRVFNFTSIK